MVTWDQRFLSLAELISSWSKDPSTKVGAVIVKNKRIVSVGFNGLPTGVRDQGLDDRDYKYETIIHAEINAILFAKDCSNCTLYTFPFFPCSRCASIVIQSGIERVVSYKTSGNWEESIDRGKKLFEEAGICISIF